MRRFGSLVEKESGCHGGFLTKRRFIWCHDSHSYAQSCLRQFICARFVRRTTTPKTASRGTAQPERDKHLASKPLILGEKSSMVAALSNHDRTANHGARPPASHTIAGEVTMSTEADTQRFSRRITQLRRCADIVAKWASNNTTSDSAAARKELVGEIEMATGLPASDVTLVDPEQMGKGSPDDLVLYVAPDWNNASNPIRMLLFANGSIELSISYNEWEAAWPDGDVPGDVEHTGTLPSGDSWSSSWDGETLHMARVWLAICAGVLVVLAIIVAGVLLLF